MRPAVAEDLPVLLDLYRQLADGRPESQPAGPAAAEPILARILADPSRQLLVADVDGRVVGTAEVLVHVNLTHGGQPWAIVENVVVAADARRLGAGRALMAHVVEQARAAGCYKIQLLSRGERGDAHLFYESLGFARSAVGFRRYLS
ncbi:GCN5 family acetyltransferase [Pseudofrankia sp. EUN1h]|nr:GCN5 family acetyltransferase [Pseudofrankia sp. EUN1h]